MDKTITFTLYEFLRTKTGILASKESKTGSVRNVEYPWIYRNLRLERGRILDVGSGPSLVPIQLSGLGYETYAIDINHYPYRHPNLRFVKGNIVQTNFRDEFFDVVLMISTIEHVGMSRYGDDIDKEGDKKAVAEVKRILKNDGELLLTVPWGKHEVWRNQRIYDEEDLNNLLSDLRIVNMDFYQKGREGWKPVEKEDLEALQTGGQIDGVACIRCKKSKKS